MKNKKRISRFRDIQRKFNYTYLNGVYLGINAIPDAYLLLDAPSCGYHKISFIHKTHDFFSDLSRENTVHRICCTEIRPDDVVLERDDKICQLLLRITKEEDCCAVFVCSMPMATITGVQYDLIINKAKMQTNIPLLEIPSRSLQLDWLGGYENTLLSIAKNIRLKTNAAKSNTVAVVGYFFDRNEGDHIGNLKEFTRTFESMSLNLASVWLSGSPFEQLKMIEKAGVIISLPYARKAARAIAARTKADVIELNMPLGIDNTRDWIIAIAKHLRKTKEAHAFIDKELKEIIPLNNLIVPDYVLGKKFSLYSDPYLSYSLATMLTELGGKMGYVVIFGTPDANRNLIGYNAPSYPVMYEPLYEDVFDLDTSTIDTFIGNSQSASLLRIKDSKIKFIEFGFPSFNYHCLTVSPFLGFKGYVNFLNRIVNNRRGSNE